MREHDAGDRSPAAERAVTLTDAVVAIAMTLLVLPLVEAVPEVDGADVWGFVDDHLSLFISFVVSFLVILLFWGAHQRVFERVDDMTGALRMLNGLWLLAIAFLPFPTALLGSGPTTSTAPVYIGTVFVIAVLSASMARVAASSDSDPADAGYLRRRSVVASAAAVVLLVGMLASTVNPDVGLVGLLLIAPIRWVGDRWADRSAEVGS